MSVNSSVYFFNILEIVIFIQDKVQIRHHIRQECRTSKYAYVEDCCCFCVPVPKDAPEDSRDKRENQENIRDLEISIVFEARCDTFVIVNFKTCCFPNYNSVKADGKIKATDKEN